MGLFSFFSSSSRPVSTDKLPKSADALRKLYYRAHRNEQYDAVVTILEKLDSLNALSKDDCKTLDALRLRELREEVEARAREKFSKG